MSKKLHLDHDIYWQLLRSLEENVGKRAGALDAELIRQAYAHFNEVTGANHKPEYLHERVKNGPTTNQ